MKSSWPIPECALIEGTVTGPAMTDWRYLGRTVTNGGATGTWASEP